MICEYTMKEFVKDAKRADLKFVTCDSNICDYCARKLYPDDEFEDAEKCNECIHQQGGLYRSYLGGENHFLGIQCVTWKEE